MSAGFLLVTPRKLILFVDSRYREMAEKKLDDIQVMGLETLATTLKTLPVCGIEGDEVTVEKFFRWKRKYTSTKFVRTVGVIEEFRRHKSEREVRMLKRARRLTRELLRRVPSALHPGITEEQLARQLRMWALELGADGLSFDPIVGFGTHTAVPHHNPTTRALQKGHLVQIDVGVLYKGYCGDMSEVYFTVPPTALQKRVYRTLNKAKNAAMDAVKPGVTNHRLDHIARSILAEEGIEKYFTHALGHGVGLEIHEGVSLSQKAVKTSLVKNEVITIEPGAYFPGKFGMRVEDMIVVA